MECGEPRSKSSRARVEERLDVAPRDGVAGQSVAGLLTRSSGEAVVDRRGQALPGDGVHDLQLQSFSNAVRGSFSYRVERWTIGLGFGSVLMDDVTRTA